MKVISFCSKILDCRLNCMKFLTLTALSLKVSKRSILLRLHFFCYVLQWKLKNVNISNAELQFALNFLGPVFIANQRVFFIRRFIENYMTVDSKTFYLIKFKYYRYLLQLVTTVIPYKKFYL